MDADKHIIVAVGEAVNWKERGAVDRREKILYNIYRAIW